MDQAYAKIAHLTLRMGLAFALLYPPIAALSDPESWFGYFPRFIRHLPLDPHLLLNGFGVLEVIIALWILIGYKIRVPAALAAALLIGIVGFNLGAFDLVFRDLSIAAIATALVLWPNAPFKDTEDA